MPCLHKFKQYLNLEKLDFEPTTLIVGTFNPAWPAGNQAEWFYGRTDNNAFWDVLPRLYEQESLIEATPVEWKQFCQNNKIAITDLISCVDDAIEGNPEHEAWLKNYSDSNIALNFQDHSFVNIVQLLQNHPEIKNVYLTRGVGTTFWRRKWRPIRLYCNANGKRCRTLLTPSGYAYYQQGRYNNAHLNNQLNLEDYILMRWQEVWHQI